MKNAGFLPPHPALSPESGGEGKDEGEIVQIFLTSS